MRKIGFSLLCAGGLFTTNVFSTTYHTFTQGLAVEYILPVNEPQVFSNIFFWKLKATCTIISELSENPLSATMLRKSGSINDIQLAAGDSMGLTIQAGDKLNVTADSGAKVELVNRGEKTVIASCATA